MNLMLDMKSPAITPQLVKDIRTIGLRLAAAPHDSSILPQYLDLAHRSYRLARAAMRVKLDFAGPEFTKDWFDIAARLYQHALKADHLGYDVHVRYCYALLRSELASATRIREALTLIKDAIEAQRAQVPTAVTNRRLAWFENAQGVNYLDAAFAGRHPRHVLFNRDQAQRHFAKAMALCPSQDLYRDNSARCRQLSVSQTGQDAWFGEAATQLASCDARTPTSRSAPATACRVHGERGVIEPPELP